MGIGTINRICFYIIFVLEKHSSRIQLADLIATTFKLLLLNLPIYKFAFKERVIQLSMAYIPAATITITCITIPAARVL